jgi:tetratricopeptide (TPR) repeat protein
MKWIGIVVLLVFGLAVLVARGPAVWDSLSVSLAATNEGTAELLPSPITDWGECRVAHVVGRRLLLQEEYETALPSLQIATMCAPHWSVTHRWAWFDLGRAQYGLGQMEAAAQSWQTADAYRYVVRMATAARENDDLTAAQNAWMLASLVEPQNGQPYVQLGNLSLNDNAEEAKQWYEQAIAVDGNYAPAYHALGSYYLRQANSPEQALPYFQKAHELAPDNIEYLVILARQTAASNPAQAIYWQALTAARPENAEFWRGLGQAFELAGCPVEATAAYEQGIALRPNSKMAEEMKSRLGELAAGPPGECNWVIE